LIKYNHELIHPIKSALRYELWSERYLTLSDASSDDSVLASRRTAPDSYYSKASILDMTNFIVTSQSKHNENPSLYNSSKVEYIIEEAKTGPIELFTSVIPEVRKGFLLKSRNPCGDFIKRFYFLKNNLLYYYG